MKNEYRRKYLINNICARTKWKTTRVCHRIVYDSPRAACCSSGACARLLSRVFIFLYSVRQISHNVFLFDFFARVFTPRAPTPSRRPYNERARYNNNNYVVRSNPSALHNFSITVCFIIIYATTACHGPITLRVHSGKGTRTPPARGSWRA
jgi:hypothetical protein